MLDFFSIIAVPLTLLRTSLRIGVVAGLTVMAVQQVQQNDETGTAVHTTPTAEHISVLESTALLRAHNQLLTDEEVGREAMGELYASTTNPDLQNTIAELLVTTDTKHWPTGYRGEFLRSVAPAAIKAARKHKLPPSITMAQAVLESGWGQSKLAKQHHNLFGVKAASGSPAVTMGTTEFLAGQATRVQARFRTFNNWDESIDQHAAMLDSNRHYASARQKWSQPSAYLRALAPIYATDPNYVVLISSIVKRYDLGRWDNLVIEACARDRARMAT